jgi:hypothetical protein
MEIGPSERFFVFLDGEYLGQALIGHFGLPEERGYSDPGRGIVKRLGQEDSPERDPDPG